MSTPPRQRPIDQRLLAAARAAYDSGDFEDAMRQFDVLLRKHPRDANLLQLVGLCLGQIGRFDRAADHLGRAARMSSHPLVYANWGVALQHAGRFDGAMRAFDAALQLEAGHPVASAKKANLLIMQGRADEAVALMEPLLDGDATPAAVADLYGRACQATGKVEEGLAVVRRALASADLAPDDRATLLYRLGRMLDERGESREAFEAVGEANRLRSRGEYDPDLHTAGVQRLIASWPRERHAAAPRSQSADDRAVLIVGMPRSGTSLVEQILDMHPDVHGAGESGALPTIARRFRRGAAARGDVEEVLAVLDRGSLEAAAREYVQELSRGAKRPRRVTDKSPANDRSLGLVDLMLPASRVIHCTRDPLDTCLSCFFEDFGPLNPYALDLAHLARYYNDYRALMDHWRTVVDLPILDVAYEDLVHDEEAVTRRMVAFLDLPWHDDCLRFHESDRIVLTASSEQVHRPIYTSSVGRARAYDDLLGPLKAGLAAG